MKRLQALLCAAALLLALCGCSGKPSLFPPERATAEAGQTSAAARPEAAAADEAAPEAEGSNAAGNTQQDPEAADMQNDGTTDTPEGPEELLPEEETAPERPDGEQCPKNAAAHRQETLYGALPEMRENYELAAEIGSRYGVYLRIADLIPGHLLEEGNQPQRDPELVREALLTVDTVLSAYPEGYFDCLLFPDYSRLEICIIGFCPLGMGYATWLWENDETCLDRYLFLVLDAENEDLIRNLTYTLPHELTHLTDSMLQARADAEEGHLFSEAAWSAMNPEGFTYANGDQDAELAMYDLYYPYFEYSYGCKDPLEDRATLFGGLMQRCFTGSTYSMTPEAYAKLGFYLQCLRDGFDTANWPEETAWEKQYRLDAPLQQMPRKAANTGGTGL